MKCGERFERSGYECPYCQYRPEILDGHLAFAPELAEESEGFEASYFDTLSRLEQDNFWFTSRNRLLTWTLQHYFPNAEKFLEIGCGTAFVLSGMREAVPELALSGSEVFTAGLSIAARRLPEIELFQMDARRIPFAEHFDVVGAFDVLEHIREDELVLTQMHQATRKGGGIILTVPQHASLWSQVDDYAKHVRRYSASELRRKVERCGFKVLRMTSFVSLLLPLMFLSRWINSSSSEAYDPAREFKMGPAVNFVLARIMDVERLMIRLGCSFPAGGSLLLIARRV